MTLEATQPRNLLRRLYDWCIDAAHKPHAMWTMGAIAFTRTLDRAHGALLQVLVRPTSPDRR